jgi:hypothetical protein
MLLPPDPVDTVAGALASVLREHFSLFLSERQSHLGREAHIQAVLRRIACGEPGATMVDGHYLLSADAHREELAMMLRLRRRRASEPPKGGAHA